jgi:cytochrome c oxidase subunit 4
MMETKKNSELRRGVLVFLALAVLTVIEYIIGTNEAPTIFLWVIALLKAALVLVYFMHITRLSGSTGGD